MTRNLAGLTISGLAIGWLVGLSLSPVLNVVLASLLTVLAGATAVASGMPASESGAKPSARLLKQLDAIPIALLIVAIATGASLGASARARNVLGGSPIDHDIAIAAKNAGLSEREVWRRYVDNRLPPADAKRAPQAPPQTGIYSASAEDCSRLSGLEGEALLSAMKALVEPNERKLLERLSKEPDRDDLLPLFRDLLCRAR